MAALNFIALDPFDVNNTIILDDQFVDDNVSSLSIDMTTDDGFWHNKTLAPTSVTVTEIGGGSMPYVPFLYILPFLPIVLAAAVASFARLLCQLGPGISQDCTICKSPRKAKLLCLKSPLVVISAMLSLLTAFVAYFKALKDPETSRWIHISLLSGMFAIVFSLCAGGATVVTVEEHDYKFKAMKVMNTSGANALLRYLPNVGTPQARMHYQYVEKRCNDQIRS